MEGRRAAATALLIEHRRLDRERNEFRRAQMRGLAFAIGGCMLLVLWLAVVFIKFNPHQ